ncbi:hypothetical protein Ahy_B06g083979 [Arachis hypogaea]|uniref:PB1-like domain-containing protein n=1 Tax=Arachis hypogaea TaxID=3818 RepID=A0A444YR13_ARAHY|nr:hypothetical protein Ahy_B06g083979 [Arachis hypogaea]
MRGQTTIIEDINGDRWSVFEAYEELRQFGYLQSNIAALWYKDLTADDSENNLKMLKGDSDVIEMCKIAGMRGLVELFVVHDVGDAEGFPKGDSANDIHFTDIEEEYEYDNEFVETNYVPKMATAAKGKRVGTSQLSDEEGVDSDELEIDHMIGGDDLEADDHEEDADGGLDCRGQRFLVHKPQKDMTNYKLEVETLYASRQEFKDTMLTYTVHTTRSIKFKKCDLVRVRVVCQKDYPFWLYAHRVRKVSTWQLRSMNLQHTCMQIHRVGIKYSKWLGKQFKKKVEYNLRIKIKELVAKAHKKWNLTVTKSMAAKTKQEALSQIQGAFSKQYKRINDYCDKLLRANPGSSIVLKELLLAFEEVIRGVENKFCEEIPWIGAEEQNVAVCKMSGIPCLHAISCITFKGMDLESYVDDYYKKDA